MQGETEERTRRRKKKKKSKFGYYLYAVVVLILTIANITLATLLLTYVQSIQVTGTEISQKSEIIAWIEEDPLTKNSIYTWFKFKTGSYTIPVYLEDVEVTLTAPWKVKAKVTEKQIVGGLLTDNSYVYFDEEGLVLLNTTEYKEDIPFIEGLQVEEATQYEVLQLENEKVIDYFVSVVKEVDKNELDPDRVVWEEDSMDLYFGDVCVKLGKSNFDKRILQIPSVIEKLEGKNGTLHLEHYTSESKNFSFEENVEENIEEIAED